MDWLPLTAGEVTARWDALRNKYPDEFAVTPRQVLAWRQGQIRDSLREGNLAAARALLDGPLDAEAIVRKAMDIAADICVYTNRNVTIETLKA